MTDAVIVAAARTPIGRAHKGSLVDVDAFELGKVAVREAIDRSSIPTEDIDDIVLAESLQGGGVIARYVAVDLGLPSIPGLADNRHCAAGLSAIQIGAGSIRAGMDRVVVTGGTESLSSMVLGQKSIPASAQDPQMWMSPANPPTPEAPPFDMALTVGENTARIAGVTREEADEWAYHSHIRAAHARDEGLFDAEIVPVGDFARDEHPRANTTLEKLASLPVIHPEIENAVVTAGNSAGLNDAAAAVVVTADDYAAANGLAPTLAIPKALDRAGMSIGDIELFEINEAFCTMAVASTRALGIDHDIVNVNGSGCGLGHPIAATGARMVVSMIHELRRRELTMGCVAMCAGGGMGSAMVLELL